MNVKTFLIEPGKLIGAPLTMSEPDKFTAVDIYCVTGLETPEGNVVVSKETWKRIELFLYILREVSLTCNQIEINKLLIKWQEKPDEQKPGCCQKCGKPLPKEKLQAHHHDYKKPAEVNWYCDKCHKEIHRELERLAGRR
jgi:hypothetical protein